MSSPMQPKNEQLESLRKQIDKHMRATNGQEWQPKLDYIMHLFQSALVAARIDTYKFHNLYCDVCGELREVWTGTFGAKGELLGGICKECWIEQIKQYELSAKIESESYETSR